MSSEFRQDIIADKLAEKVLKLTGSRSEIVLRPLLQDEPRQCQPEFTLAKRELGWAPSTPLDEGLKETIAYFRSVLR